MDDSPLVSQEIKDYCKKNKIEETLEKAIQLILTVKPTDPFAMMCSILKEVIIFMILLYLYLA
jgi:hypothetical protein